VGSAFFYHSNEKLGGGRVFGVGCTANYRNIPKTLSVHRSAQCGLTLSKGKMKGLLVCRIRRTNKQWNLTEYELDPKGLHKQGPIEGATGISG